MRVAALLALLCSPAQAQDDTLAITLIAEATYNETDHAAILHVLDRRADRLGVSIEEMARRYSAVWKRRQVPTRVFDAMRLRPEQYRATLRRIERFRAGKLPDPCRGKSLHWGDRLGDRDRAMRAGWKRLRCGERNMFWSLR